MFEFGRSEYQLLCRQRLIKYGKTLLAMPDQTRFGCGCALNTKEVTGPKLEPAPSRIVRIGGAMNWSSPRTSDRPKQIGVSCFIANDYFTSGKHHLCFNKIVDH